MVNTSPKVPQPVAFSKVVHEKSSFYLPFLQHSAVGSFFVLFQGLFQRLHEYIKKDRAY